MLRCPSQSQKSYHTIGCSIGDFLEPDEPAPASFPASCSKRFSLPKEEIFSKTKPSRIMVNIEIDFELASPVTT